MIKLINYVIIPILLFTFIACGNGDSMAHIGIETDSNLTTTNVTDTTLYYDTTHTTTYAHLGYSSFIIKNGSLWAAGLNFYGELGLGDNTDRNVFTDTGVTDVKSISNGYNSTFIIKTDGSLWSTGKNNYGQLGLGDSVDRNTFIDTGVRDVKSISCSGSHSLVIKTDGTLWVVGYNINGGLGLGDNANRNVFTDTGVTNVKLVSAGSLYSMITKTDDSLWSTGKNDNGQLGLGDIIDRNVFTDTGVFDVGAVSCGRYHTVIIKIDNSTLWSTGDNVFGQLGLGDNTDRVSFIDTGLSNIKEIACGYYFTLIIKSDGSLWSTGDNFSGQLGLGDNTNRNAFIDTGVTSADFIFGGNEHSLLLKTNGTLWGSGKNTAGQLGLGDNANRNVFTATSETPEAFVAENWIPYLNNDIVRIQDNRYVVSLVGTSTPNIHTNLTLIGVVNELKPFDGQNITPAISTSPMTYKITGTEEFNAFTLAKVLADSVTYTFRNSVGTIIGATTTVAIDTKRDENGILSAYPTTVVFYADQQMEANSTVEISLTRASGNIELGDFTLNNAIDAGFTNLGFSHRLKDFNEYTPDAFGNIPEAVKAIVTTFNVSMDVYLSNYDYAVSFNESITGQNVTIDASDSNGVAPNGSTIFGSLTRRVRVTNPVMKTIVKDGSLGTMAQLEFLAQEIV